ncbi:MAG TPA: hypothetical protein VI248_17885, partial [Kineosporiaceae bacterium]
VGYGTRVAEHKETFSLKGLAGNMAIGAITNAAPGGIGAAIGKIARPAIKAIGTTLGHAAVSAFKAAPRVLKATGSAIKSSASRTIAGAKGVRQRWTEGGVINAQKQAGHLLGTPQYANRLKASNKLTSVWRFGPRLAAVHTRVTWTLGRLNAATGARTLRFPWRVGSLGSRGQRTVRVTRGGGKVHGTPWFP